MQWSGSAIGAMPRVATIATMPSRLDTFQQVLPAIHSQVDHVFIYLDGYRTPPGFLAGFDRITVRGAEELGDLRANSRYLCLRHLSVPTVVVMVDDDIAYPPDYVDRLARALQRLEGRAVVGVHGRIFVPPHRSYVNDVLMWHFSGQLTRARHVHELGTGTCAFISSQFDVDPRDWGRNDMDDIDFAIEAQRRRLPRVALGRAAGWLKALGENQPDSLWNKTRTDDSEQSRRMRVLLGLYAD